MLKKRIIAVLNVYNDVVVQSKKFTHYLPVGKPPVAVEFLNRWGIDEIAFIDITARKNNRRPEFELVKRSSTRCQVPLAVGGGITTLDDVHELMQYGADKVILNQPLLENRQLITNIAHAYGDQCVVVSIDATKDQSAYRVYNYKEKKAGNISAAEAARIAEEAGAGEIMINSVERDGSYEGYAIDLINEVCNAVTIPVIATGGARNADDMIALFKQTEAAAAAAGNFFHFSEHSVIIAKKKIHEAGISIRLETHADYKESNVDAGHRLQKKSDEVLENLLYMRIEKEII